MKWKRIHQTLTCTMKNNTIQKLPTKSLWLSLLYIFSFENNHDKLFCQGFIHQVISCKRSNRLDSTGVNNSNHHHNELYISYQNNNKNERRLFKRRMERLQNFQLSFSSLFFDDDDDVDVNIDDINWDEEEDDDHGGDDTDDDVEEELNFNIQYQGRITLEEENYNSRKNNSTNDMSTSTSSLKSKNDNFIEDDTDETYYEQLFMKQAGLTLSQEEDDEDVDDDELDELNEDSSYEDHEKREMLHRESIQNAEEYYQSMRQLKKEFNSKRYQLQNQSKFKRNRDREIVKRTRLEERAMFLALRALRRQNSFHYYPTTIDSLNNDSTDGTNIQKQGLDEERQSSKSPFAINTIPLPTLSFSSTRNYKCREDYVNEDIVQIEKRLYGNRFKNAYNIYVRLLETLDEIKLDSKRKAQDYLLDKIERSVHSNDAMIPVQSDVDRTMEINMRQKERMNIIISLSLYGIHQNNNHVHKRSNPKNSQEEKILKSINAQFNLDSIDIQDLESILRIRGNVKRRGRLPKSRDKIMEQLIVSFSNDLFSIKN